MVHVFIVNPQVGKLNYADELREKLSQIPNLEYYVFTTFGPGHERELAKLICNTFQDEQLRIYSVGGTGTFHNIIGAIDDLSRIELAMIPTHPVRFIEAIGADGNAFADVVRMVNGSARPTDVISVNGVYTLNAFSIGVDSDLIHIANKTRRLGFLSPKIPYSFGLIHSVFATNAQKYHVDMGEDVYSDTVLEIFFGNGRMLGNNLCLAPEADVHDGLAFYRIIRKMNLFQKLSCIKALATDDTDTLNRVSVYGKSAGMRVRREDGKTFVVNVDGELMEDSEFQVEIVPDGMRFVYPQGV